MLKEILEETKETPEESLEIIEGIITKLSETNKPEYNILKLSEELAELQEKLLKYYNKHPDRKPKAVDIVEEVGDVLIRIGILIEANGWEELLEKRVNEKARKLIEYYESGKYVGGI